MKTLWDKGIDMPHDVKQFTIGNDIHWDKRLALYDVQGSKAHANMLGTTGLLTPGETEQLLEVLDAMEARIKNGTFHIPEGAEDIHSAIEFFLVEKLGTVGKKIHAGRSRNDQVLTAIHLYIKDVCKNLNEKIHTLFTALQKQSKTYADILMPGYTHARPAMPSSFALWLGAYAELLVDDTYQLHAAWHLCNQNPLGSAAGYGNSFPIDREATTQFLGFGTLKYNSIAAQMSRGRTERSLAYAMAMMAGTLNRLASDCCLFSGPDYRFFDFPEALTTGSSIMPHKKNPDVWELIRAHTNAIQGIPGQITLLCTNLTHGYHRDYQLLKDMLFPAVDRLMDCFDMALVMIRHIQVNPRLFKSDKYDQIFTVEEVNRLVMDGMPFRDAYHKVALSLKEGTFMACKTITHTHSGSIGNPEWDQIDKKMEAAQALFL